MIEYVAALADGDEDLGRWHASSLLRQALRGLVPDALLDRPKHGFEVPTRRWLLHELSPLVRDLLLAPQSGAGRFLDSTQVRELWGRLDRRPDHHVARQMWTILNFAVWYEQHWPDRSLAADAVPAA